MTDLWTPSDRLLSLDPIAVAKVASPHVSARAETLADASDDANQAQVAVILAELDGDDMVCDENGDVADDDDVMDDDAQPTEA